MRVSKSSNFLTTLCFSLHILIILATKFPPEIPCITISCGSSGSFIGSDGRVWIGDSVLESSYSPLRINGESSTSSATDQLNSVPYRTARVSRHEFTYVFPVNPGQKFIRLHFNQDSYKGLERSRALFTVKAGHFTLLSSFSADMASDASGTRQIIKEYAVNIDESRPLTITFTPSRKTGKSDDFFAFINGIEVVSMPTGLYFTPEGELGARVVGHEYRFYIDNSTALELVRRLNIGGTDISPAEDSRMFRRWDQDSGFLMETGAVYVSSLITVKPTYIAHMKVYQTARTMHADAKLSAKNLTWKIPVDLGFRYLIRLHFSESDRSKEFSIVINDQIAEANGSLIRWDQTQGDAVYRDYVVMMEGDKMVGNCCITITFLPKFESKAETFHCMMKALEVFKLSNLDNNLASIGPGPGLKSSTSKPQQKKLLSFYKSNLISAVVTVILALLNIAVYHLRISSDSKSGSRAKRSSSLEHLCRRFSIDEIRSSTDSFNPKFQIGSGGYGRVYKGIIDGGTAVVAIKRLKTDSKQGEKEFQTEIKMLSKMRHKHLVSLIGYCDEGEERTLIYQYMSRGTLSDHLYKTNRLGRLNPPLSWELRLKISIGAANGLYYLHRHRAVHRDVKSSNILLDENWVAKIADFGLSKMGPGNESFTHISSSKVKGTFGYLDPEYFLTEKFSRKSDIYSFGVVLFEVLSGRRAVDMSLDEEQHSLAGWARYCIQERKVDRLIDQDLTGQISPASLKVFIGIAGRCLNTQPQGRPLMAEVVKGLVLALAYQHQTEDPMEEEENAARIHSDRSDGVISMDDLSRNPSKAESDMISSEDNPSSSTRNTGGDQKNDKTKSRNHNGANTNSMGRWWWDPFGIFPRTSSSKSRSSPFPPQGVIHQFSLWEIQNATNSFHSSLIIGFGGSDNVYRGYIDSHKVVAIRWSRDAESRLSMAKELQSKKENQMKSSPSDRHHVASLIGYCETESDMILVYDYMANGTLHDHLHDPLKDPLPWKQRLQICIGAAKGLSYIISKVKQTMLHRDLKSTNIWLDENWTPKVSEWGLLRNKDRNSVPVTIRRSWAYLDSDYIRGDELTEKSYVYSFGLVLFEVIFAAKEPERWLEGDQVSQAQWIKSCMRGNISGCIDPFLVGRVSPDSLALFVETAGRCLLDYGVDRPSMIDIVARLEDALNKQETTDV